MNSAVILISLLAVFSLAAAGVALYKKTQEGKTRLHKDEEVPPPVKSVQLFTDSGDLLFEYKECYITHWSETIYLLSHEHKGKTFLKFDKGANMLLLVEYATEDTRDKNS